MKRRAALVLAVLAYAGQARAEDDPFAAEYVPPKGDVVGTSGGQFRMFGTMGGFIGSDIGWSGQGTMELMTHAWIGIRGSSLHSIPFGDDPQLWSFRMGPSLHLLRYHVVDLSIFGEGGFSLIDISAFLGSRCASFTWGTTSKGKLHRTRMPPAEASSTAGTWSSASTIASESSTVRRRTPVAFLVALAKAAGKQRGDAPVAGRRPLFLETDA
jgi:hypothetical protein